MRTLLAIFAAMLALAACGSDAKRPAASTSRCPRSASARAIRQLRADVAAIQRAARRPTKDTLAGSPAVSAATDRFLLDVARARVSLLVKNRFVDHAAAALVGSCEQCFQALEASRPIPGIAHGGRC